MCIIILMYLLTGLTVGEEALRNGANDIIVVHRYNFILTVLENSNKMFKIYQLIFS